MAKTFLESWMTSFGRELNDLGKRGALSQKWFLDGYWNEFSWLHARIFGALIRSIERPLIPMVETKWGNYFVPDLFVVEPVANSKTDSEIAVIGYESTNSSDERVVERDLPHFAQAIGYYLSGKYKSPIPLWWIVVTTLPDSQVSHWPWYYAGNGKAKRDKNPLGFYNAHFQDAFQKTWRTISSASCNLVWVNLMPASLRVMNLNGQPPVDPLQVRIELPESIGDIPPVLEKTSVRPEIANGEGEEREI